MKKILLVILTISSSHAAKYVHISNNTPHTMFVRSVPLSYEKETTVNPFSTGVINQGSSNPKAIVIKDTSLKNDELRANQQIQLSPVDNIAIVLNPLKDRGGNTYGFVIKQRTNDNAKIVLDRRSPDYDEFIN